MKQGQTVAVALGCDAAVLQENSNDETTKIPKLTIYSRQYVDDGVLYPASAIWLFGCSVRGLYDMLREYYGDTTGGQR
jgi:hypothetical protein